MKKHVSLEIQSAVVDAVRDLYDSEISVDQIQVQKTRKEFEGDFTVVVFPLLKISKTNPVETGNQLGEALKDSFSTISDYNVIKGFLNVTLSDGFWIQFMKEILQEDHYGLKPPLSSGETHMVEYSSPNTNKPLHLGHLRNIFLGHSVSEILKANGHKVIKTQIINDRGIHICKSMVAWLEFASKDAQGNRETPETAKMKGDHFVGKYYVIFDQNYKKQIADLMEGGMEEDTAKNEAPLMKMAREMLLKWESNDKEVYELWQKMNGWVYSGFEKTYERMGVDFDHLYYESDTYLLGKDEVLEGLEKGVFFKKDDGSIWCDLTDEGLDEKLILRKDGTAVYMTQDIGTAIERFRNYKDLNGIVYTVGNEQDYHFKVLFLILKKLGYEWAKNCFHLSYGMVDLPSGKMKSREGTVVDADDLMQDVVDKAKEMTHERGHLDGLAEADREKLFEMIGLGGLKYYLLKVNPKKRLLFNPEESVDLTGHTGPFIQYAHARISSLIRKAGALEEIQKIDLGDHEKAILRQLYDFREALEESAQQHDPSVLANYLYDLVKMFNQFYQSVPMLKENDEVVKNFRLQLSGKVASVIKDGMSLLGIEVPEQM